MEIYTNEQQFYIQIAQNSDLLQLSECLIRKSHIYYKEKYSFLSRSASSTNYKAALRISP